MRRSRALLAFMFAVSVVVPLGCGGGGGNGGGGGGGGTTGGGNIVARITTAAGAPVSGVRGTIGSASAVGNEQGFVVLTALQARVGALLQLQADGFVANAKRVDIVEGAQVTLDVTMAPIGTTTTVDTTGPAQVRHRNGGVNLAGGSVVDQGGSPVASALVSITTAQPSDTAYTSIFPGPFLGGPQGGATSPIQSYGFVDVNVTDAAGNKLRLAPGTTAEVLIPIDPATDPGAATIPMWYFDETTGVWVQEGTLTRDSANGVYRGTVTHFTTWNCDQVYSTAYKRVRVQDDSGAPVSGAWVVASGQGWESTGTTDATGVATVPVPANAPITVTAQKGTLVSTPITETSPGPGQTMDNTVTIAAPLVSITMTWGASPSDLDSYLFVPTSPVTMVYYGSKGSLGGTPWAALDTDDTTSYGPEIVSVTKLLAGTYRYYVRNYSGQESGTIEASGCRVTVAQNEGAMQEWIVPTSNPSNDRVWHVFDLGVDNAGNVSVVVVNAFVTDSQMEGGAAAAAAAPKLK